MKIKNIIFDFDGVLVKNIELMFKINQETLKKFTWENFIDGFDGNALDYYSDVKKNHLDLFYKKWKKVLLNEKIEEGAKIFLEENKEKKLFIISSNSEGILNKILENSNLEKTFKKVLGAETHSSKIEKFLILQSNEENINLEETIFITDSLGDLKEASHFPELKTIAVTFGVHNRERLKKGNPNFIIDDWDDIKKINIF